MALLLRDEVMINEGWYDPDKSWVEFDDEDLFTTKRGNEWFWRKASIYEVMDISGSLRDYGGTWQDYYARRWEAGDYWLEEGGWDLNAVNMDELKESKATFVFGQMNEPPGARARVALSGLTIAEYFRDGDGTGQGKDILFFVDNIFRFTQAGSEVSALLGRMPSAVGYQPTLATEMGVMQERIT